LFQHLLLDENEWYTCHCATTLIELNTKGLNDSEPAIPQTEESIHLQSVHPINNSIHVTENITLHSSNNRPYPAIRPFSVTTVNVNPISNLSDASTRQ